MVEELRYYWFSYSDGRSTGNCCTTEHPFDCIKKLNKSQECTLPLQEGMIWQTTVYNIVNWRTITVEDYNKWKDLYDN